MSVMQRVKQFKYTIPVKQLAISLCVVSAILGFLTLLIFILVKYASELTILTLLILGIFSIPLWVQTFFYGFAFHRSLSKYLENRRNPCIILHDDSITLPFEKEGQPIHIRFKDIIECKETFNYNEADEKKQKDQRRKIPFLFILAQSATDKNLQSKYQLLKENMDVKEYEELKSFLLQGQY